VRRHRCWRQRGRVGDGGCSQRRASQIEQEKQRERQRERESTRGRGPRAGAVSHREHLRATMRKIRERERRRRGTGRGRERGRRTTHSSTCHLLFSAVGLFLARAHHPKFPIGRPAQSSQPGSARLTEPSLFWSRADLMAQLGSK
jgi:hypothetical protein